MITALDHIVLVCPDIEAGVSDYETLLGHPPVWRARGGGAATAVFKLGNTALELMGPDGDSEVADKLREMTATGAKLTTLVYRSDNLQNEHRLFSNRGLAPSEISAGSSEDTQTGATRHWNRFRIPDAAMSGVKTFVLQPETGMLPSPAQSEDTVTGLDHAVINTPNPERALARYGAKLGLDLRMDRKFEAFGARMLFFRIGDLILEMLSKLDADQPHTAEDVFWGLSWRAEDLGAAHKRLSDAGLQLSDIRPGRKTGSRVFTVKSGTLNVPTLFIGPQEA